MTSDKWTCLFNNKKNDRPRNNEGKNEIQILFVDRLEKTQVREVKQIPNHTNIRIETSSIEILSGVSQTSKTPTNTKSDTK